MPWPPAPPCRATRAANGSAAAAEDRVGRSASALRCRPSGPSCRKPASAYSSTPWPPWPLRIDLQQAPPRSDPWMTGGKRAQGTSRFTRHLPMKHGLGIQSSGGMHGRDCCCGTWWDLKLNCIATEGQDFAQYTEEGGADQSVLIPDSDEERGAKGSSLLSDDDEHAPETEPQDVTVSTITGPSANQGRQRLGKRRTITSGLSALSRLRRCRAPSAARDHTSLPRRSDMVLGDPGGDGGAAASPTVALPPISAWSAEIRGQRPPFPPPPSPPHGGKATTPTAEQAAGRGRASGRRSIPYRPGLHATDLRRSPSPAASYLRSNSITYAARPPRILLPSNHSRGPARCCRRRAASASPIHFRLPAAPHLAARFRRPRSRNLEPQTQDFRAEQSGKL